MPKRLIRGIAVWLVLDLASASTTLGASEDRLVTLLDDCDAATFNAVIGPGTCVKDGGGLIPRDVGNAPLPVGDGGFDTPAVQHPDPRAPWSPPMGVRRATGVARKRFRRTDRARIRRPQRPIRGEVS